MLWVIVIIAVVLGGGALLAYLGRRSSSPSSTDDTSKPSSEKSSTHIPQPVVADFHVNGAVARTVFEVPLGDAPAGRHLVDLLSAGAVEYLRRKQDDGFPLDDVTSIDVFAMRGANPEKIGTVELPAKGTLPEPAVMAAIDGRDPIASIAEVVADTRVSSPSTSDKGLEPVASFVQLTGPIEARLRSIGVDPSTMNLRDLVIGLMQMGGYSVAVGRPGFRSGGLAEAEVYRASKAGSTSTVVIFPHTEGDYPEVEENQISELAVAASQIDTDQLILVTDKYGPYSMYERERRTNKLVFVTRERLQAFVDSFGLT